MTDFDITIRGGRIASDVQTIEADIGIVGDKVAAVAACLPAGRQDIDATGRWVLPGGIDSHCHIEQLSGMSIMGADDWYSATVSAAFGGTTTVIPFAAQHRGMKIPDVLADYAKLARAKAVIDYSFHLIVTDPDEIALSRDLPQAIRDGITSFKVYMTYDLLKLDDYQLLDVLALARREGALVMVHAENHDMIRWITRRLLERGHTAPALHAVAHDPLAESEAAHRVVALSQLVDVPVLIVHVAGSDTVEVVRASRKLGAQVLAETCPQYLFLHADDLDRAGLEGAKFCCSPPPRDAASQEAIWTGLKDGTLGIYSSDHSPYRFDKTGKLPKGDKTTFKDIANGVPGIELRMPLLFSEGVGQGRISINEFVALTSTNHARTYGLASRKGKIEPGFDADLAIWNTDREVRVTAAMLHDSVGYTPYEGRVIRGWPELVMSRGRVIVQGGQLNAEPGSGQFIARSRPEPLLPVRRAESVARNNRFSRLVGL
jgi:dihydropyrimidinase